MKLRYPEITVKLTGVNGNAYVILSVVRKAMRKADVPTTEVREFMAEAMSGDYDHLLQTVMKWVEVE